MVSQWHGTTFARVYQVTRSVVGAIYHLTDELWVIPALKTSMSQKAIGLVYDAKVEKDKKTGIPIANPNEDAIKTLKDLQFFPRK